MYFNTVDKTSKMRYFTDVVLVMEDVMTSEFMQIPREYGCVGSVPEQVEVYLPDGGTVSDMQCVILYIGSVEKDCYPFWGVFSTCSNEEAELVRQGVYSERLYVATGLLIPELDMRLEFSHMDWMSEEQWKALVEQEKTKRGEFWTSTK
jgi:hypothetical protein